jgi:membrane-bound lytic murein transglycosylase D
MATFEIQGGWILFAHPTERITPNKVIRVHEKKCFIPSLYISSLMIGRRVLARLLHPDQLVPLMPAPLFHHGKRGAHSHACIPEDRYGNLKMPSIFLAKGEEMVKSISIILVNVIFLFGCVLDRPITKESEKRVVQGESSEKQDALAGKLKSLEQSVSRLQSEVKNLENQLKQTKYRPPLTAYKLPKEVFLCGERIPTENKNVWENLDREFLLGLSNDVQVLLWMKRARRYFPHIEKRLRDLSLPDDLKYVTIVESGLRPYAVSPSGAGGIWQFIPATGDKYEMRKNRIVDERFDFFKATEGALAYLKALYEEFGSWALSLAAYNAGENRVQKEIGLQGTRDYYFLDFPLETERYVYKIAVAKMILSETDKYGFHLDEKEFYDPLQVERVQIELAQPLPIIEVSRALGCFYKDIKELNPHFSEDAIPPGIQFVNLPPGTSVSFWAFFSAWKTEMEGK